jgi:midasin (ATPase involved in ribosome maturation)
MDHRIIEILELRPSNRLPVSYYMKQPDKSLDSPVWFLYLYSKIVQSEQSIYWTQSSDWIFILVWVQNLCSNVFTRIVYKTNFK